jgi:Ser/Thr protein kinase RdoA (MazF antagonist)
MAVLALEQYDLPVERLRLITNDFNGIFRIDTVDRRKYVLRVSLPEGGHDRDGVQAEMAWLDALGGETELSVPSPLTTRSEDLLVEVEAPGVPEPRLCVIFNWMPGVDLAKRLSTENLFLLGALMARLHQHALTFRLPENWIIPCYDRVFPYPEPILLLEEPYESLFPPSRRSIFQQAIEAVELAIENLRPEPLRIIHNDLHQWNVRVYRKLLSPIDFEDLVWGWPVQDIATCLYYFISDDRFMSYRQAFQQGYISVSPWPEGYPGEVDRFIAARGLQLANFILTDPNPAWRIQAQNFVEKTEQRIRNLNIL